MPLPLYQSVYRARTALIWPRVRQVEVLLEGLQAMASGRKLEIGISLLAGRGMNIHSPALPGISNHSVNDLDKPVLASTSATCKVTHPVDCVALLQDLIVNDGPHGSRNPCRAIDRQDLTTLIDVPSGKASNWIGRRSDDLWQMSSQT